MLFRKLCRSSLFLSLLLPLQCLAASLDGPLIFSGMCDASAAVAFSPSLFAVANDEDNIVRFYRVDAPGGPLQSIDLKPLLSHKRKMPEADFEGAARIGNRMFLITSHGRNATGKPAPFRHRLLALDIRESAGRINLRLAGRPYTNLVADLSRDSRFRKFRLDQAALGTPKEEGSLNVEALTDTPDSHLLIGFRSPLIDRKALVIPLLNPNGLVSGQPPVFGNELLLDLRGLGLRGIGSMKTGYYLIGGPVGSAGECRLFSWSGPDSTPTLIEGVRFHGVNPEGVCFHDQQGNDDFLILSDDGTRSLNGTECKLLPEAQRQFRAFRMRL
jgi:hypothetical protein